MILAKLPENPDPLQKQTYSPPLGLWSMRSNGCPPVRIVDAHLHGIQYLHQAISETPKGGVLGLSVQFATQEKVALEMIARYGDRHDIVLGGPHGSQMDVPGVQTWRGAGEPFVNPGLKTFADMVPPYFEQYEIEKYWGMKAPHGLKTKTGRWMTIETSRGCVRSCGFCAMPEFWGKMQFRPMDMLESHIRWMKKDRGIEELFIEDDNVSLDRDRFIDISEMLRDLRISWSCPNGIYARSLLDSRTLHALARSTCWAISIPFETGSMHTANLMGLGQKWLLPHEALLLTADLNAMGIETTGFFIIGYPGEKAEDVRRTLEFANNLPLKNRNIYFATPYPGTKMEMDARQMGWLGSGVPTYRTPIISTEYLDATELYALWQEDREAALKRKSHEAENH